MLISLLLIFVIFRISADSDSEQERTVGLSYDEDDDHEYLVAVLESFGYKPWTTVEAGKKTTYWRSESNFEEMEIQNRISQRRFLIDVCGSVNLPLPSDPAKEEISC